MNTIQRKRLLRLIRHAESGKLHHPVFDFSTFDRGQKVDGCRTNGCLLGECPMVFPEHWKFRDRFSDLSHPVLRASPRLHPLDCSAKFFGVSYSDAERMFTPYHSGLSRRARPKTVAKHLRKWL